MVVGIGGRAGERLTGAAGGFSRRLTPVTRPGSIERRPVVQWAWGLVRLDFTGIAFAALFFCWSLTPSLLPRDWLFQGLIGGISAAIGYTVGAAIGWAVYVATGLGTRSLVAVAGTVVHARRARWSCR